MTIAESLLPLIKGHQPGSEILKDVLLADNVDNEGTAYDQVLAYTDGSMLIYDDGTEAWVAGMWDNSGDDLDSDIYQ